MASVKQRGHNRYLIIIYLYTDEHGKRINHHETFYGPERQAWRYANELEARLKRDPAGPRKAAMTVGEYLRRWITELRGQVSERAWETYEYHVRKLVPVVGHLPLYTVTAPDLRAALSGAFDLAPKTIQGIYGTLRYAFRQAAGDGLIAANPASNIRGPRVPHKRRRVLKPAELAQMLDAARTYKHYPVVRILALYGMRMGEALGLKWANVDLKRGLIHVVESIDTRKRRAKPDGDEPKTDNSHRTIRIEPNVDPETVGLLKDLRRKRLDEMAGKVSVIRALDDQYVFGGDRPLGDWSVRRTLNAALKKAGLGHIRPHDLRHGAGSILVDDGVEITRVAALLGHTPETLMRIYAHSLRTGEGLAGRLADVDRDVNRNRETQ